MKGLCVTQLYHYLLLPCCMLQCLVHTKDIAKFSAEHTVFSNKTAVDITLCVTPHITCLNKHQVHIHSYYFFRIQFNIF